MEFESGFIIIKLGLALLLGVIVEKQYILNWNEKAGIEIIILLLLSIQYW